MKTALAILLSSAWLAHTADLVVLLGDSVTKAGVCSVGNKPEDALAALSWFAGKTITNAALDGGSLVTDIPLITNYFQTSVFNRTNDFTTVYCWLLIGYNDLSGGGTIGDTFFNEMTNSWARLRTGNCKTIGTTIGVQITDETDWQEATNMNGRIRAVTNLCNYFVDVATLYPDRGGNLHWVDAEWAAMAGYINAVLLNGEIGAITTRRLTGPMRITKGRL